ncbi:DUF6114 domain-containing protein [Actinoplanes derwentensis]|uniref:Uncharacterized protein n=1 Tax=Actinoplanes derwentensis TaxID=113562 RepID=A0A1H1RRR5_9ACTN|nr:DUF6114 domain-containing protein [Actinoplanes derwentensis]GID84502.1 hypothetical protein Ade03nite_34260 [Actinoplanes derwentensis]SDS38373.1 hypothetical protein SAMN04489716_0668 [Actinoplanes derwentensis]
MAADTPARAGRSRARWRDWRRSRPFWAGLLVVLGGLETVLTVWAPLPVVLKVGMQNFLGFLIPVLIVLCGLLIWFNPAQRMFYSLVTVVLSLSSWLTSNMGGFVIGLLFGLIGGSLAFAWNVDDSYPVSDSYPNIPDQD